MTSDGDFNVTPLFVGCEDARGLVVGRVGSMKTVRMSPRVASGRSHVCEELELRASSVCGHGVHVTWPRGRNQHCGSLLESFGPLFKSLSLATELSFPCFVFPWHCTWGVFPF